MVESPIQNVRARDIGIPLSGRTGKNNCITDVPGVEVGYCTVVVGDLDDYVADQSLFVRSGVTAILPSFYKNIADIQDRQNKTNHDVLICSSLSILMLMFLSDFCMACTLMFSVFELLF